MLDLLYPPSCALCRTGLSHAKSLCPACAGDLPRIAEPFCETCGEMFTGMIDRTFDCPNCANLSFSFEFARPVMLRDERTLDLVHRLKYNREIHLAPELAVLAHEAFADPRFAPALEGAWPLIPVPLHPKRLRWRHFNQAAEIANPLARLAGSAVLHALRRVRPTDTQTLLSRHKRMANLRGAFAVTRQGREWIARHPAGAVLVDDVLTTGSTVNECAKTLKKAGIQRIFVVTVMRG
jgi:ComF family protein